MAQVAFDLTDVDALRGIMDAVPHPIFVKDADGRFVIVNKAMCHFMGRNFDELVGKVDEDFVPPDQAAIYRKNDQKVLVHGEINENEEPFSCAEGPPRTIITRKSRFLLRNGEALLVGCITDISDFRRAEAMIRHNAEHDHLTGLANRSLFSRRLQTALSENRKGGDVASLLLIDLDGFKAINDTLGHGAGDNVLVQAANALRDVVGDTDDIARLGGDEFAVVRSPAPPAISTALASAIVARFAQPTYVSQRRVALSASIGVAFSASVADGERLFREADIALYAAKADGKNCFRTFQPTMLRQATG